MAYSSFYKINITLTFYYFDLVDEIVFEKLQMKNKILVDKIDIANDCLKAIKRNKTINEKEIETMQKNLEKLNNKVINTNDKMGNDQNQLFQEVMNIQQMMDKFQGEMNNIKNDNKELKEGYKNLVNENKEIKEKAEITNNRVNNLEDIAENSGAAKMSELKKRLKELEKKNQNKAYYSQVFQENLYSIILKYRMNKEGYIENKELNGKIGVGIAIGKGISLAAQSIPIIGKIITISEKIVDKIIKMRENAAYENQRQYILNTFYETKSLQTEYDFQMLCFEVSLIIAESTKYFDDKSKKNYKEISSKGNEIVNFITQKKEELKNWISGKEECPFQEEAFIAMEDVSLLIVYIAKNSRIIINKWKSGVSMADILAKSVLRKDIETILQLEKSNKEEDDKVKIQCCLVY